MIKIIYIMGAARSGSTLLDIFLGNAENAQSCGELNRIPKRFGIPPGTQSGEESYDFWREILTECDFDFSDSSGLGNMFKKVEYHKSFLKQMIFGEYSADYVKFNRDLFEHLSFRANGKYLVDSSKYPGRALALSNVLPRSRFQVLYVYLKRDPVAVVRSFQKQGLEQPPKGFASSLLYYFLINMLCVFTSCLLKKRGHKVISLRYEDFCGASDSVLKDFENAGLKFDNARGLIGKKSKLNVGKLFDGNRIRMKASLTLERAKEIEDSGVKDFLVRFINKPFY